MSTPRTVPAAASALDVLTLLSRRSEPMPAAAIARELGLPRSTTYELLGTLHARGFVAHLTDERRYGLGLAAVELGSAYARQAPLQRLARPLLARLVDRTTHSGHFAVMHGSDVVYVAEERAPGRPPLVTDVGVRLPAQLTASGLAMLAGLPAAQVRALFPHAGAFVSRGHGGPATLSALRRVLTDTRARGYAIEVGTVTPGYSSVAVAVRDHLGLPVAAFAVTYPSERVRDEDTPALAGVVRDIADELSARLRAQR